MVYPDVIAVNVESFSNFMGVSHSSSANIYCMDFFTGDLPGGLRNISGDVLSVI